MKPFLHRKQQNYDSDDSEEMTDEDIIDDWLQRQKKKTEASPDKNISKVLQLLCRARTDVKEIGSDIKNCLQNCLADILQRSLKDCLSDERVAQLQDLLATQKELTEELRSQLSM